MSGVNYKTDCKLEPNTTQSDVMTHLAAPAQ